MHRATLAIRTSAREEMLEVTRDVRQAVAASGLRDGIVTLYVPHTTAAVTINENADPDVQHDMLAWLRRLVPPDPSFRHAEGNSDGHIKSSLVGISAQVPVVDGELLLGRWQGIYFCEFDGPRLRQLEVVIH
ncbi:MAG: secondary thiamine-phosphate synthase enzyme YjbQ [Dehalococcoidia bacterium]|nr:secondary thiamine-phosphate synthase enzyme YjbQ [Dehalococcoidia bacterium]